MEGMESMKLRGWVKKVLVALLLVSVLFIATTGDSELSKEYIIALVINLGIVCGSTALLIKYGE